MKKKYGIRNASECVLRLPIGGTTIVCNFTNGNLQSREPIPASYTTDNPIIQHVIENCDKFKGGGIFIMAVYQEEPKTPEVETKNDEKPKKVKKDRKAKVNEDVKTFGEAVTALMVEDGVNMGELVDVESCQRVAERLGISFPNLK